MTTAIRHPGRSALICAAVAVGGVVAVLWGALRMTALGHETLATALSIAFGGLGALFGVAGTANFVWGARRLGDLRAGRGVVARWLVPAAVVDRFRETDRELARSEAVNDAPAPRRTPAEGLPVVFGEDGVMVGDAYVGLVSTGLARFAHVRRRDLYPPVLEFGTVITTIHPSGPGVIRQRGVLRIPIAPDAEAEAARVLTLYQDILARRVVVNPDFWPFRIRLGVGAAVLGLIAAAAGFALRNRNDALSDIPVILAVVGVIVAIGGLILAGLAASQHDAQRRPPGR